MTNFGVVSEVKNGVLTIVFDRPEACGDCHNCMRGSEDCAKHTITLCGEADVGDIVTVEMDDSHVVAASALAYMIPLAGFLLGLVGGWGLSLAVRSINGELMMALCAIVGTALAYGVMRRLDPVFSKGRWEPKIIKVTKPVKAGA